MSVYNPFDFFLEPEAETYPFDYAPELKHDLAPYLVKGPLTPKFKALVDSVSRDELRTIDFLVGLNQRLQREIGYLIRMEPGVQTPEVTLTNLSGSLPRHRLAAGAAAAPPGAGGALRLRLPDPAEARRQVARRPQRHRGRLHRPARLVRGLPARAPAGSGWTRPRG